MTQAYKVALPSAEWFCEIEINDELASSHIQSCVESFYGWQDRLAGNEGNYTTTFLRQVSRRILNLMFRDNYTLNQIISTMAVQDGYPALDGSTGINLLSVKNLYLGDNEFAFETIYNH